MTAWRNVPSVQDFGNFPLPCTFARPECPCMAVTSNREWQSGQFLSLRTWHRHASTASKNWPMQCHAVPCRCHAGAFSAHSLKTNMDCSVLDLCHSISHSRGLRVFRVRNCFLNLLHRFDPVALSFCGTWPIACVTHCVTLLTFVATQLSSGVPTCSLGPLQSTFYVCNTGTWLYLHHLKSTQFVKT